MLQSSIRRYLSIFIALPIVALADLPKITLPAGERFTWGQEPVVSLSQTRAEIVLNGLWLFRPTSSHEADLPWAAIRVPGSWDSQAEWGNMVMPSFVGTPPAWPSATFRTDAASSYTYLTDTVRGSYQREITIPKEWVGRRYFLTFERISTDSEIFINDKKVGETRWPSGDVDLTNVIAPGAAATLRVQVTAVASENELIQAMREDYADKGDGGLRQRGIIGDVIITARPAAAHLDYLAVETSVSRQEISVTTAVADLTAPTSAKFTATITEWPSGILVKTFTSEAEFQPFRPITLKWSWPDAKRWDIGQPHLYNLNLKIDGPACSDALVERFGFREFRIEGRNFMLNGTPFFGRLTHSAADHSIGGNKQAADAEARRTLAQGYNLLEIWPNDTFRRGFADFRAAYARSADEAGIFVMMPLVRSDDIFPWRATPSPEQKQAWLAANQRFIQRVRNHPSIAGYLYSGNDFMTADDQNPLRLGNSKALAQSQQQDVSRGLTMIEDLRALDPTRWITSHSNANVGDVHTGNHYLGLTPLQEREETLSYWAREGDRPYGAVEFCSPFSADLHRARMSWNAESEPLATEFMAAILGPDAYQQETPAYRDYVRSRFDPQKARFTGWPGGIVPYENGYSNYLPYQQFQIPQVRKIWRAWRTYGVSLGMIQWENLLQTKSSGTTELPAFQPGTRGVYKRSLSNAALNVTRPAPADLAPVQAAYFESIQPLMAYIGGPLDRTDGWVSKDHHFTSGGMVRKSVVLINDGRTPQQYSVDWKAARHTAAASLKGTLGIGEKAFLPIEFTAPVVAKKTDLKLKLAVRFGDLQDTPLITDEADIRIYPILPKLEKITPILSFDPEGKTDALLRRAGFAPAPWNGKDVSDGSVLVIGRRAMSSPEFDPKAFRSAVLAGARAVLFSQDPQLLRERGGIRVHQWINRQFWPVETQKNHPLSRGMDAADFRDWAGSGSLLPPGNHQNLSESALRRGYPTYGYRVGSRGSVSSAAWEKPHHSGWTPLLEGEFDMAYSPLMELRFGRGYLLNCSLDLEERTDPASDLLTRRVIESTITATVQPRREVFYLGDSPTEISLKNSGLVFTKLTASPPAGSLIVAGPGASLPIEKIRPLLAAGTHILLLGLDAKTLPQGITASMASYGTTAANTLPDWPELKGISPSDLRLRTDMDIPLIAPSANVSIAAGGLLARVVSGPGVIIAFQGNPAALDSKTNLYYRFSEWRWTRTLSQLLTNMGAVFASDDLFFKQTPDPFVAIELAGKWKVISENTLPPASSVSAPTIDPGPKTLAPALPDFDDSTWPSVSLPAMDRLGDIDLQLTDGSLWARRKITIPFDWQRMGDASLVLGTMDDHDTTYFNGTKVAATGSANPEAKNAPRSYRIPAWMIKPGAENTIAIRLFDQFGSGGFSAPATPLSMRLELRKKQERPSIYVLGFLTDKEMGDDPARYTRW